MSLINFFGGNELVLGTKCLLSKGTLLGTMALSNAKLEAVTEQELRNRSMGR